MPSLPFKQVDVFTANRFRGNPVAVVLRADDLDTAQMQQIAHWTHLSETTFVVPVTEPGADYHVRIFTPGAELPFAGHPTIGTAHALLEAGMISARDGVLVQQCGAGLVRLAVSQQQADRWIALELPEPTLRALDEAQISALETILGQPVLRQFTPCMVDVGPRWIVVQLANAATVLAAKPDLARMREHDIRGHTTGVTVFGAHPAGAATQIEVRSFAPAHGVDEDPVCGSGNGCVAAFIRHTGQIDQFGSELLSSQGAALGRAGIVRLNISDQCIRVGGMAVTCIDGQLSV